MPKKSHPMLLVSTVISFWKDDEYRDLLLTTSGILGFGTVVYHYIEEWSWIDSLYFSVITLTTIGYGDFSPQTDVGKVFTIFYIILGLGIILSFINTVQHHYAKERTKNNKKTKRK